MSFTDHLAAVFTVDHTAEEIAAVLGVEPEAVTALRGEIVLTHAQARRLLVLARKAVAL